MVNNIFSTIVRNIKKSFSWSGRASRKEFVIFHLFFYVYTFSLYFLINCFEDDISNVQKILIIITLLMSLFGLKLIFSSFSLIVRRLHDLNTSAWWLLITFIPFGALLFFALPFKKGSSGTNKYGEPPIN